MAVCVCTITRKELLTFLVAIFLFTFALEVYICTNFFVRDDDLVPRALMHSVITVPSQSSSIKKPPPRTSRLTKLFASASPFKARVNTAIQATKRASPPSHPASYYSDIFNGRVPERVVIPEGANIHFSVRTGWTSYDDRFPIVFLTWIQTVPPQNVNPFHALIF